MPEFNSEVMKNIVKEDRYLSFVFTDLSKRNKHLSENEILEVLFNSNVIEDSDYESIYLQEL